MKSLLFRGAFVFALIASMVISGCDSTDDNSGTPEPMSSEAFTMDTDMFSDTPTDKNTEGEYDNFINAALRVWPVSAALKAHLAVPFAATKATLNTDPTLVDGEFHWSTTASANSKSWSLLLTADPSDSYIDWSLFVTASGNTSADTFDNFELIEARTDPDGQSGSWTVYYKVAGQRAPVLSAEFDIESETEKEIEFTVPLTAVQHAGDKVRYRVENKVREFYWKAGGLTGGETTVTWNTETKVGSIVSSNYNGGAKACWDASFKNTTCQ